MRIKASKIVVIPFLIFLFAKIQTRFETPLFDDNLIIIIYCLFIMLFCLYYIQNRKFGLYFHNIGSLFLCLVIYAVLFVTVFRENSLNDYINAFMFAFLSMVIYIFGTVVYFSSTNSLQLLLQRSYILISGIMTVLYLVYFDSFATIKNISTYFSDDSRSRSAFGIVHPNTTAEIIMGAFAILLLLYSAEKEGKIQLSKSFKRYVTVTSIIMFIEFISTSCRGGLLSVGVSLAALLYWNYQKKVERNSKIVFALLIISIGSMVGVYLYTSLISSGVFDIQFRIKNFTINIPNLISKGEILTGFGFVEKSVFSRGLIVSGTGYTDNYYLYVLVSTGIIGCIFVSYYIIKLWRGISKKRRICNSKIGISVQSINVMALVFALTEATYISPVSILCLISMIIMLCYASRGDDMLGDNINCNVKKKVRL